jgi:site-specific recombinase XerD
MAGVRRELERCGAWLRSRRPRPRLEDVDSDLLIAYIRSRSAFHAKSTQSSVMSKLRGFGEFLTHEGIWSSNPLRWMQGPRIDPRARLPRRIARPTLTKLWETAATSRTGYHRRLWVTLLSVLYGTGARRGELVRLNLSDWNREESLLLVDGLKTGRERRIPVSSLVWRCIEGYLPQRQNHLESLGIADEPALFVNRQGQRISCGGISNGLRSIVTRCGDERITLHQFRHTCASDLLEDGAHLVHVQQLLGHQNPATTMRYLHVADRQLHVGINRHPINDMLLVKGVNHE